MVRSISFETTVDVDYDAATAALREQPEAVVLDDPGARTLVLHADVAGFDVARAVTVTIAELRPLDPHAVALPLRWEATEKPRRFPTFDGMVELSTLSQRPPRSQLALVGTVSPPLGALGTVGDAAGGAQLADSVLEALLDRMAARVTDLVAQRVAAAAATPAHMARPRRVMER